MKGPYPYLYPPYTIPPESALGQPFPWWNYSETGAEPGTAATLGAAIAGVDADPGYTGQAGGVPGADTIILPVFGPQEDWEIAPIDFAAIERQQKTQQWVGWGIAAVAAFFLWRIFR